MKIDAICEPYKKAIEYKTKYKDWRWGQCIFNAYYDFFPNKVNEIRGSNDDCFYDDNKVMAFLYHFI